MSRRAVRARVRSVDEDGARWRSDRLAGEAPLEIRLEAGGTQRTAAVTLRTPGDDVELALGFLFAEGIVADRRAVRHVRHCRDGVPAEAIGNVLTVALAASELPPLAGLERLGVITSACGVCGRGMLDDLETRVLPPLPDGLRLAPAWLRSLPERLRAAQPLFDRTGGLHAAALFDPGGALLCLREDVGRHNAVDKVVGWALREERLPLSRSALLVSGRLGYEIAHKARVAGIPVVAAVSAPSSLAVELGRRFGLTLVGFLRGARFNVYCGEARIDGVAARRSEPVP